MKEKCNYQKPVIELIEFQLEKGIAQSGIVSGNGSGNDSLTEREVDWD